MGSMNVEMAKAQLAQLVESFRGVNQNLKKEKVQMEAVHDQNSINEFHAKAEEIQTKLPAVQSLTQKLSDYGVNQEEPVFADLTTTLNSILNKDNQVPATNTIQDAEEAVAVNNSMNKNQ